jgi:MFS family permease
MSIIKIEELLYALYHFPIAVTSPFISLYYFDLSGGDYLGSGLIISIPYLFLIFSSGFFGRLSDKIGSKNLVLVSLAVFMLSFVAYFIIDRNPPVFFGAYIGFNIIISAFIPAFNRIVSFQEAKKRASAFGKLGMWASAGFLCGSLLTTFLVDYLEFRIMFLIAAAFASLAFIAALKIDDTNSNHNEKIEDISLIDSESANINGNFGSMRPIFILLLLVTLTQITNSLYISFFAIFIEKELNQPRSRVSLVNTLATLIGIFGTYAVGRLLERYKKKSLILIALAFYFLLPFCTYLLSSNIDPISTVSILLLYSIPLYSIFFVVTPVFLSENSPVTRRGQAMGLNTSSQYFGMTLGTMTGAALAKVNGIIRPNFVTASLFAVFSILIGIFLFKEPSKEKEKVKIG